MNTTPLHLSVIQLAADAHMTRVLGVISPADFFSGGSNISHELPVQTDRIIRKLQPPCTPQNKIDSEHLSS
jgi:hypothetical protein